jgi:hypothetical protein
MATNISEKTVNLHVSKIFEDLNNGLTWYKKDDLGFGSIQEKYGAKDEQIDKLLKNSLFKNAQTTVTIFNIIDDRKNVNDTKSVTSEAETKTLTEVATSDLDAFANL